MKKVELENQRGGKTDQRGRRRRNPIEDLKREVSIMRTLRHKNIVSLQVGPVQAHSKVEHVRLQQRDAGGRLEAAAGGMGGLGALWPRNIVLLQAGVLRHMGIASLQAGGAQSGEGWLLQPWPPAPAVLSDGMKPPAGWATDQLFATVKITAAVCYCSAG